jgi:hypothetical protein
MFFAGKSKYIKKQKDSNHELWLLQLPKGNLVAIVQFDEWWQFMARGTLLASWEVWNECNDRIFRNKSAPSDVVFDS